MLTSSHTQSVAGYFRKSGQFYYILIDLQGRFISVNPLFQQRYGHMATDLFGGLAADIIVIADRNKYHLAAQQCIQNPGTAIHAQLQIKLQDGSFLAVRWEFSACINDMGNPESIQAVGIAVDEIKKENQGPGKRMGELPEGFKAYEQNEEGLWMFELRVPVSTAAFPEEIIAHSSKYAFLAECNDNMARMHGFSKGDELVGSGINDLMDLEDPKRLEYLKSFIRNGFKLVDVESKEMNRYGVKLYFINNITGIVEEGLLKRIRGTQHDITKLRMTEHHLQQSELFYRNLFANSLDGVLITDEKGTINFASASLKQILGYSIEETLGKSTFDYAHPDDRSLAYSAFMNELAEQPRQKFISIRLLKKSGEWTWCIIRGHNLMQNPYVRGMVIYFYDDTLRKKAEEALSESEKRFRSLIYNLSQGVVLQNEKGEVIIFNRAAQLILGITEDKLVGTTLFNKEWNIIHEDGQHFPEYMHPVQVVIQRKRPVRDVVMGVYRPGTSDRVWLLVNADPVLDNEDNIFNIICSFTDITEQKRLSHELIEQEIQKQRQLTQATIDGQEKERLEIGKELHDNISQHLTTTKLYLEVGREKASDEVLELITLAHKNLSDIINELRQLSQSLVPPTLGDLGMIESVKDLCDLLKKAHTFRIEFYHRHFREEKLPDNLKLMLFRIIQEQINNIIRHAHANTIQIRLQSDAEYILLIITDNGKGFDPFHYRKGLGLTNITNRANLFNGKVEIDAAPGKGCSVSVTIPLPVNQLPRDGLA